MASGHSVVAVDTGAALAVSGNTPSVGHFSQGNISSTRTLSTDGVTDWTT